MTDPNDVLMWSVAKLEDFMASSQDYGLGSLDWYRHCGLVQLSLFRATLIRRTKTGKSPYAVHFNRLSKTYRLSTTTWKRPSNN